VAENDFDIDEVIPDVEHVCVLRLRVDGVEALHRLRDLLLVELDELSDTRPNFCYSLLARELLDRFICLSDDGR
jgi:hypothetical protein